MYMYSGKFRLAKNKKKEKTYVIYFIRIGRDEKINQKIITNLNTFKISHTHTLVHTVYKIKIKTIEGKKKKLERQKCKKLGFDAKHFNAKGKKNNLGNTLEIKIK